MSLSPLSFTGVSTFSEDFQQILDRAVRIASLPIQQLQNQQADLIQQKMLVSNLSAAVGALAAKVSNLGTIGQQKALTATSSNSAKVTATNINATSAATYTLSEITSVAKAAAETTVRGYATSNATPVSSTGIVKLIVGSNQYTIDISANNSLVGIRDAINALNAGVTASVLTTGTGADPNYLSITANATGATTLELRDDPTGANVNLLTTNNQGANTVFKLNGVSVSKPTAYINDVVPGVTFTISDVTSGAETVTVTLASDRNKLSAALQDFVSAYNEVRNQINAQVGENAGLLSGDYLVREVQARLRALVSYQGTGAIQNLTALGVEFDSNGVATFNPTTFNALSDSAIQDAFTFLGSATTGFGALASTLTSISDSVGGLAKIQIDKYDETDERLSSQIEVMTQRVADLQRTLSARLQAADALLASLEGQQQVLDATLKSLQLTLFGKQEE